MGTLAEDVSGVLRGENKPTFVMEFSASTYIYLGIIIISTIVISGVLLKAVSK
jgi:ribosomal protein L13